ncbi:MAG: hypothetical protein D6820_02845 [Lentisphaerae bacterium]|nr:MAG: hypothetical protein D6820_02845 [Lentisphaerota bacterium]
MAAYNRLNGTFMCENKKLLTDILRREWGFKGFVLSDFGRGVRSTVPSALAGLNVEMHSAHYYGQKMIQAVKRGELSEAVVDRLLSEKLYVMFVMGIFDHKWKQPRSVVRCPEHLAIALDVARKAAVLLKNEGSILPLDPQKIRSIAVIGPNANGPNGFGGNSYMQGGGSGACPQVREAIISPLRGTKQVAGNLRILYAQGCPVPTRTRSGKKAKKQKSPAVSQRSSQKLIEEAVNAARQAEVAVLFVGLNGMLEGEGHDRRSALLPAEQEELIKKVANTNPRTIVFLTAGSYIDCRNWIDTVKGLIFHPYCGEKIGQAMAEILFGKVNPGGKLPVSFPQSIDQYPKNTMWFSAQGYSRCKQSNVYSEGIFVGYRYLDRNRCKVMFPFGYGLSYTTFRFERISVYKKAQNVVVDVTISNTGSRTGDEVVQLYVRDMESSVPRPVRELKGFKRVTLAPGQRRKVSFVLKKDAFAFWHPGKKKWTVEPGLFTIDVGPNSRTFPLSATVSLP